MYFSGSFSDTCDFKTTSLLTTTSFKEEATHCCWVQPEQTGARDKVGLPRRASATNQMAPVPSPSDLSLWTPATRGVLDQPRLCQPLYWSTPTTASRPHLQVGPPLHGLPGRNYHGFGMATPVQPSFTSARQYTTPTDGFGPTQAPFRTLPWRMNFDGTNQMCPLL